MTTTKSFSKTGPLRCNYLSTLRRLLPLAITAGILLFAMIVLPYLVDAPNHNDYYPSAVYGGLDWTAETLRDFYTGMFQSGVYMHDSLSGVVAMMLAIMGFAGALISSHYLHSKKMTDLYHSLPLTRGQLLLTNMAASLTAVLAPYLLIVAATAVGQLVVWGRYGCFGSSWLQYLLSDLLLTGLFVTVVWLLTTFVAVNVGTTLDALMVSGVVGFLPSVVYVIGGFTWQSQYYGAAFTGRRFLSLNPFLFYMHRFMDMESYYVRVPLPGEGQNYYGYWTVAHNYRSMALLFAVWLVVAALLLAGALLCYRRRRSEIAGQTQPGGVFQMIAKCFACFCGAAMGMAIYFYRALPVQLIAMLITGFCIGLIAELLLSRSVKFLRRNMLWLAGASAVCCLAFVGLRLDLTGYIQKVPADDRVAQVELTYSGRHGAEVQVFDDNYFRHAYGYAPYDYRSGSQRVTLSDPEAIALVTESHRMAVENIRPGQPDYSGMAYSRLEISYTLQGGGKVNRVYYQMREDAFRNLALLEGNGEFILQTNPLYVLDRYLVNSQEEYIQDVAYVDVLGNAQPLTLGGDEVAGLLDAMRADALARPLESLMEPVPGDVSGFVRLRYDDKRLVDSRARPTGYELWIEVGDWSAGTNALLGEREAPDLSQVDRVFLAQSETVYEYLSNSRYTAVAIKPEDAGYYEYYLRDYLEDGGDKAGFLEVTDARDRQALYQAGLNMSWITWETVPEMVAVLYQTGEDQLAIQLVSIDRLPASLQQPAREMLMRYMNRYDEYGYDYYDYGYSYARAVEYF